MKNFLLIVGESGSGKSTVANELSARYGLKVVQSYTTRPPRFDGESGHIFVCDEEFNRLTDMVAFTEFDGHRYCATTEQVEDCDIYVIDPEGVEYFKDHYVGEKDCIVLYLYVDEIVRYDRMVARGDSDRDAFRRINHDHRAFSNVNYDLRIDNNDLDKTVEFINKLIFK